MLPFRRFHGFKSWLDQESGAHVQTSLINGGKLNSERKSTEACKSHREAERRRRQRINSHLSTLRSLLPNAAKSDKASLLAEVVQYVKRLRKEAEDVANHRNDGGNGSIVSTEPFPGETDEGTVSYCDGVEEESRRMKATVCCEDRPGLNHDLTQAIRSVRATAVRAEMMTVGGRFKSVVVVQWPKGENREEKEEVGALERALKAVIEDRALVGSEMGLLLSGQKRARDSYCSSSSEVDCGVLTRNEDLC